MALIWMDGFDHYGTGADGRVAMLDAVWAELAGGAFPQATNPRTGACALRRSSTPNQVHRRVLGGAKTTVGLGAAFWIDNLPTSNGALRLFEFRDAANAAQVSVFIESTGVISAYRGLTAALLGQSAAPAVAASAYQHAEAKVVFDNSAGSVEVRVNGVTVLSVAGVDTVNTANVECSQVCFFNTPNSPLAGVGNLNLDDVFAWDDTGTQNNDFLGDRRVRTIFPDADTATEEWTATGATDGFDCINDAAPDDETTYISALPLTGSPPTPLTSIYGLQDPPAGVGSIAAVQTYVRMRKTEAGDTNVQVSLLSSGDEAAGADRAITEAYTYWTDVHELNPNTGTPWSESSLGAAQLQIKRTV